MQKSIWDKNTKLPSFQALNKDITTDVLVIGGGLSGILTAYYLTKAGIETVLTEGSRICSGTTKNTTAKITSQHGLIYDKMIKSRGKDIAKLYIEANQKAIEEYKNMSEDFDCDFELKDAYTYTLKDKAKIEKEVKAVNSLGVHAKFEENLNLPFKTLGAVKFKNQAQFNPLKFVKHIVKNLNIYENTFITGLSKNTAQTEQYNIKAKKIIIATHFPFLNKHGFYFIKMYQSRSYVLGLKGAQQVDGMYLDEADGGLSFRNYKEWLILGGEGHRTGKANENWTKLKEFALKNYPKSTVEYRWAAQDCMSLDKIPYIGRYSKNTPDLYLASGFNKWGISSSMVAAKMLTDLVQDRKNEYETVFSPDRSILKPQLFINAAEAVKNLFTPTTKRCPHLGCALKWNKAENSWDCPCHGSRFTETGKLIDNPATGNAKIETKQNAVKHK